MSYYDNTTEYHKRGIDYALSAALEHHPQSFTLADINHVYAVWEGEKDGSWWRWLLTLKAQPELLFVTGRCDFKGWNFQSELFAYPIESKAHDSDARENELATYDYEHGGNRDSDRAFYVAYCLMRQLRVGKSATWREGMDDNFGLAGSEKDES